MGAGCSYPGAPPPHLPTLRQGRRLLLQLQSMIQLLMLLQSTLLLLLQLQSMLQLLPLLPPTSIRLG